MLKKLEVIKKIISMTMVITMIVTMGMSTLIVKAAEDTSVERMDTEIIIDGSELLSDEIPEASSEYYGRTRGIYLLTGSGSISKVNSKTVAAFGSTTANFAVDSLTVYIYVEQFTGSKWRTVSSWGVTDKNDYYVSSTRFVTVQSGYYYRVRTFHNANGDTADGCTDGIKIS